MMDDFERRVQAEIDRLNAAEFPRSRRARQMRGATIRALAEATVVGKPWTGEGGVLGPKRPSTIVSENNFYGSGHWYTHPLVGEVIEKVTELYRQRDAEERGQARLRQQVWVEQRELEAAAAQFDMAGKLLSLSHVTRKTTRRGAAGEEEAVIINPANAPVFNAAAKLNEGASILARRALGLPTDVSKSEVAVSMSATELQRLSDEELEQIVKGR